MRKDKGFLVWLFFIFLFLVLIIFLPRSGWLVQSLLTKNFENDNEKMDLIIAENQMLKAKLAEFGVFAENQNLFNFKTKKVAVYSSYPFSFKNELLIAGGKDMNLKEGSSVFWGNGILIGRIEKVWEKQSLVRTIFDFRWQSTARIGSAGVEALVKGGEVPRLTLIEKGAEVAVGDIVYNADSRYPYGVPLGEINQVYFDQNFVFKEANLKTNYDLKKAKFVLVLIENE